MMRKLRKISIAISILLMLALLSGCSTYDNFKEAFFHEKGAESDTIQIGVLEPQTGIDREKGELEIMGIQLAHSLYPEALGKKVELVYADTQSSIYTTESAITDLLSKKPAVILGTYGEACSLVASQFIKEAKVPAITISTSNPLITVNNPYYFRAGFQESSQGTALAKYAVEKLEAKKFAVLKIVDDDSSSPVAKTFGNGVRSLTNDKDAVVATNEIPLDKADYTTELVELVVSGAEAVFMPISSMSTLEDLFKRANELGLYDITFLGTKDWHNDEFIKLVKKYPRLKIAIASDFSKNANVTETTGTFIKAYKEKYGEDAVPATETALAFDAYLLALRSIEKVGNVNGQLVRDSLANTEKFKGASGEITFNKVGDPEKTINIDEVRGNDFVSIYSVD